MGYIEDISQIYPLSVEDIIFVSRKFVPRNYRNRPWDYPGMNHGTACLSNEEQLCCYMAAYGDMHKGKLNKILSDFPINKIDSDLEIIDWGCGQGIATVSLVSALRGANLDKRIKKVTLIEPSSTALSRAKSNVSRCVSDDVYIEPINLYLPASDNNEQTIGGLHIEESICIHLFSNILDIPTINLKGLAYLVGSSGYRHYFLCVGPANWGNTRIEQFCRYFNTKDNEIFSDYRSGQYAQLANGKWYSCITKGFQIVREQGKPFLVPLSYYPPKQFFAAYRLDAVSEFEEPKEADKFWSTHKAFEVLAPFDIGASVYEDVHPILAVLNNIITRGLPTKCSTFIENALNAEFEYSKQIEKYGTIKYNISDVDNLQHNEELLRKIPLAVARIQKVIIEAVLTGHISIDNKQWKVLVKESDVPCSALAFADLKEMFNHLAALSRDYDYLSFPDVELHVVSKRYNNSALHLDATKYRSSGQVNKEQIFDMVIDVAIDEKIDAANVQFSEFHAKNDCYFNVRSSHTIYSVREIYTSDPIIYKPVTEANPQGGHIEIAENVAHLNYFLTLLFRKSSFRPGQLPILNRALQTKGVIGLLPTGGGKSLTYQLAAMLQPGVTIIIDPLKSLMEDQYDGLINAGIDCCTFINSGLPKEEKDANELKMEQSQVIFTFLSPERLCIFEFRERLQNMHDLNVYFSYGVIDEVHCVSEWGQDFRFSYLHLGRNLYSYVRGKNRAISLFGLTATASFDVLSDVERELTGNGAFTLDPETVVRYENSNRLELQYKVEKIEVEYKEDQYYDKNGELASYPRAVNIGDGWSAYTQKSKFLREYIKKIPEYVRDLQTDDSIKLILDRFQERENLEHLDGNGLRTPMNDDYYCSGGDFEQAGIVFCPHVRSTGISVQVNADALSKTCEVGTFFGSTDGLDMGNDSMDNMRKFRDNQLPIMVATKAFGMGIDKPNVRYTVNMNYCSSLESFVQEAGRAGRDRKMALSVILMSDYNLARINKACRMTDYPLGIIKNKWFREQDLRYILSSFDIKIDERFIDYCNPTTDMVKFKCNTDNKNDDDKRLTWQCGSACSKFKDCQLRHVDRSMRGWMYPKDLNEYLTQQGLRIEKDNVEYQSPDFSTVMYFFDNNFKGEFVEKQKMHELMSVKDIEYFFGNDKKDKFDEHKQAKGFLDVVLKSKPDTEVVSLISYEDDSYADIAKAIYRMCVIGLIDDFTQDYATRTFRILSTRKKNGMYYERLKEFLMRYYSEERAENEVEKASMRKGSNEIHKCLGYLTEFIYDKVASKRRRAIDDMRNFCLVGIDDKKDWKEINEDLKDEIYYYFNSKFAREGYIADNGEPFSLLDDTDRAKISTFAIVLKYLRVIDADIMGVSGSPKDNIKHLHGAVRLIRRSETDTNAALCFLNVFCLIALNNGSNKNLIEEIKKSYIEGYLAFREQYKDFNSFYKDIERFKKELNAKGRNVASEEDLEMLNELLLNAELAIHANWVEDFSNKYNN